MEIFAIIMTICTKSVCGNMVLSRNKKAVKAVTPKLLFKIFKEPVKGSSIGKILKRLLERFYDCSDN